MEITSLSIYREVKIQPRQFESATYGVTVQAALAPTDDQSDCHDRLIEAADNMLADQLLASIQDLIYAWETAKPAPDEKTLLARVQEQSAYIHLLRIRPGKAADALNYARLMFSEHGNPAPLEIPPEVLRPATPKKPVINDGSFPIADLKSDQMLVEELAGH